MTGAMARGKGASGEREVKLILRSTLAPVYKSLNLPLPDIERNLTQSRGGGYDLVGLTWLALEVKRQERPNLEAWWKQTLRQSAENQIPCLLHRANHQPWRARVLAPVVTQHIATPPLVIDLERHSFEEWLRFEAWARLTRGA